MTAARATEVTRTTSPTLIDSTRIAPGTDTAPIRWEPPVRPRRMNRPGHVYVARVRRPNGQAQSFVRVKLHAALRVARALEAQGFPVELYVGEVVSWVPVDVPAGPLNATPVAE